MPTPALNPGSPIPYTLTAAAHTALDFPQIVCLCGSTRFVDEFNRQRRDLTRAGQIVLSIEIVTTQAAADDPQHADPALKARLDELHKRKIDLADYVLVLNVGGYIGLSTGSEITYARQTGKPVTFLEPLAGEWCEHCDHPYPSCGGCGWACLRCGAAYFGSEPERGLCPDCTRTQDAAERPCASPGAAPLPQSTLRPGKPSAARSASANTSSQEMP